MILQYKHRIKSHLKGWLFLVKSIFRSERKLLKTLGFNIGEQYENYEFVLKSKGEKTIKGICYEIYLYEKDDFKILFDLPISRGILLLFNADILSAVYYRFQGNHFEYLLKQINKRLPSNNKMEIDPFIVYRATYNLESNTVLELLVKKDGNTGISIRSPKYHNSLLS